MAVYNIYYSPTGGTKKVADILANAMSDNVQNIDLFKKDRFGNCFNKDDICILSVPAFGGRVPVDNIEKIITFSANGAVAILVAVFGNRAIDDTLIELYDTASSVGFNVVSCIEAVAEHSLVRKFGSGRPNADDESELEVFVKKICDKINDGNYSVPEIPGNRPYKEFKPSAMSLVVDDSCSNCKKCARECPVDAIPKENVKTVDSDKCFSCMHCVRVCLKSARRYSPTVINALEERLKERCSGVKPNKLYI